MNLGYFSTLMERFIIKTTYKCRLKSTETITNKRLMQHETLF